MNSRDTHSEWIVKFKAGDPRGLEHIRKHLYCKLITFARKLVYDTEDAKDIVSEALIKLWELRDREGFDTIIKIRSFLYITVRNNSFNFLKQRKRRALLEQKFNLSEQYEGTEDKEVNPLLLPKVYEAIEQLSPQCRKVFALIVLEGRSTDEVAQQLNISNQTVLNHKSRAIRRLNKFLKHLIKNNDE